MANDKDPLLGALGICRKAGKLLHGYDRVEEAVMRGKACLVLLACDASKRTTQHMQDTCRGVIPCAVMPLKGEDLRMLTPKPAAVFAVTDENLAHRQRAAYWGQGSPCKCRFDINGDACAFLAQQEKPKRRQILVLFRRIFRFSFCTSHEIQNFCASDAVVATLVAM